MEGRVTLARTDDPTHQADQWRAAGATHVSVNTMGLGLTAVDGHIAALAEVAAALRLSSRPS
jgi:hypothetical protein